MQRVLAACRRQEEETREKVCVYGGCYVRHRLYSCTYGQTRNKQEVRVRSGSMSLIGNVRC